MSPLKIKYYVVLLPKSFRVYLDYVVAVRVSSTDIGALDARSLMGALQLCESPQGVLVLGMQGFSCGEQLVRGFSVLGVTIDC